MWGPAFAIPSAFAGTSQNNWGRHIGETEAPAFTPFVLLLPQK